MANERESYDAGREAVRRVRGGTAARREALARYLKTLVYREEREESERKDHPERSEGGAS